MPAQIFEVSQLISAHKDEWLALEVVERDENGFPHKVRLVAHSKSKLELSKKVEEMSSVYIRFAGDVIPLDRQEECRKEEYGVLYWNSIY